ncbi:MAG: hypothetical protein LPK07_15990 [Hymenobacteraceae bacterium]|nr:hypothetical protein [Hymenobacteraceae bacterium]
MEKEDKKKQNGGVDEKNWLEWTVFGISLLLVLSIIGYLAYQTYTRKPSTPDLLVQVRPDPSDHAPTRYHVLLQNKGGATAEEVLVELVLMKGGEEVESAELQLPFVPQESKREGWVSFKNDPNQADTITTRVVSYKKP